MIFQAWKSLLLWQDGALGEAWYYRRTENLPLHVYRRAMCIHIYTTIQFVLLNLVLAHQYARLLHVWLE